MITRSLGALRFALLIFLGTAAILAVNAQTPSQLTAKIDGTARVRIPHSVHRLARAELQIGPVADSTPLSRMVLVLGSSDEREQALSALLAAQQEKDSPQFHQWLTPEQFAGRFGPSVEDVATVERWLQQEGFTITGRARSRRWLEISGTVAQVQRTFQTSMFRYAVAGAEHIANATEISIPAALAPVVQGLISLNDFSRTPQLGKYYEVARNAEGELVPVDPQFTTSNSAHYLAPGDFAKIYNVTALYTAGFKGAGQTIAIAGRVNFQMGDVYMFRQIFGLPDNDPLVVLNGPDPVHLGIDALESSLDVEWAGAVAPEATIKFVASASTVTSDGIDLSAAYIVDQTR